MSQDDEIEELEQILYNLSLESARVEREQQRIQGDLR